MIARNADDKLGKKALNEVVSSQAAKERGQSSFVCNDDIGRKVQQRQGIKESNSDSIGRTRKTKFKTWIESLTLPNGSSQLREDFGSLASGCCDSNTARGVLTKFEAGIARPVHVEEFPGIPFQAFRRAVPSSPRSCPIAPVSPISFCTSPHLKLSLPIYHAPSAVIGAHSATCSTSV